MQYIATKRYKQKVRVLPKLCPCDITQSSCCVALSEGMHTTKALTMQPHSKVVLSCSKRKVCVLLKFCQPQRYSNYF